MKKIKTKDKLTCAHCLKSYSASKHKAYYDKPHYYGDGDGKNDRESYHSYNFETTIVDSCPYCGEDVHVNIHLPVYVPGEPSDTFDYETWLMLNDCEWIYSKYKKKLEEGGYYFTHSKGELFLKIAKAKTKKEARLGVKRKHHKFVDQIFDAKENIEPKEEPEKENVPNHKIQEKEPNLLTSKLEWRTSIFIYLITIALIFIGFYGWSNEGSKLDLTFAIIFCVLLVGYSLNELRIKYDKKKN